MGKKHYIFGEAGVKYLSKDLNINFLGEIPLFKSLREASDFGRPGSLQESSEILDIFGIKNKSFTITYEYPEKFRPPPERTRTLHYIKKRNDGSPRCVACMLCETVCPAYCINIIAKENSDPNIEKMPASFNIDLGRCIFCGFCVEACPLDAIHMDSGVFDFSAYSREKMILDLDSLLNPPKPIQPKNQ